MLSVSQLGELTDPGSPITKHGALHSDDEIDYYTFDISEAGRTTIKVTGQDGFDSRLSLFSTNNQSDAPFSPNQIATLLVESDDRHPGNVNPRIDLHLRPRSLENTEGAEPARYVFAVMPSPAAGPDASGAYEVTVEFVPAIPPFETIESSSPSVTVVSHFNSDDDDFADMAVANKDTGTVSIHLGRGDGTFSKALEPRLRVGSNPESMISDDFDGDGIMDLAVGNRDSRDVSILIGKGHGTFSDAKTFAVGDSPRAIASGDFNGNGKLDLAIATHTKPVSVFLNGDDGRFERAAEFEGSEGARDVVAADLDGDSKVDIAVANRGGDAVQVFWNDNENGEFDESGFTLDLPYPFPTPRSLVATHLNDDDKIDLAIVSDKDDPGVYVLLGNEDEKRRDLVRLVDDDGVLERFSDGADIDWIAAGDLNQDGDSDLIISNETLTGSLTVLIGSGDGRFDDEFSVRVGSNPQRAVTGHFNDDNCDGERNSHDILDVAVPNRESGDISVLLGAGDGSFLKAPENLVGRDPEAMVVADVNDDGRMDVVTANRVTDDVSVLLGLGNGIFAPARDFSVGEGPVTLEVEDLDKDGFLDIVTLNGFSNTVSILWGRRNGFFEDVKFLNISQSPAELVDLVVKDVDDNGDFDIAIAESSYKEFFLFWGNGDRSFEDTQTIPDESGKDPYDLDSLLSPTPPTHDDTNGRFSSGFVLTTNLNGDDDVDLVAINDFAGEIIVRLGNGDATFEPERRLRVPGVDRDSAVAGDFDGDEKMDLVIAHNGDPNFTVLLGNGDGTFKISEKDLRLFSVKAEDNLVTELNDMIVPAVLTKEFESSGVMLSDDAKTEKTDDNEWQISDGGHVFLVEYEVDTLNIYLDNFRATYVVSAQLTDDDDFLDLVMVSGSTGQIVILKGNGDGEFSTDILPTIDGEPKGLVTGDFDGDGDLDIAVVDERSADVVIVDNNDTGFVVGQKISVADGPFFIVSGEFDDDNDLDLATANPTSGTVSILLNEQGAFTAKHIGNEVLNQPRGLIADDFDGDGRTDLAVINRSDNNVMLLWGKGDGDFNLPDATDGEGELQEFTVGKSPWHLASGDFNGDELPDLVTANRNDNRLSLLVNHFDKSDRFSREFPLGIGTAPEPTTRADIDGDDSEDLVTATRNDVVTVKLDVGVVGVPDRLARSTLIVDINGDGQSELMTVDRKGEILIRFSQDDGYALPQVAKENEDDTGEPLLVKDVGVVTRDTAKGIVATHFAVLNRSTDNMSIYSIDDDGDIRQLQFQRAFPLDDPARLVVEDVTHDGRDEIIVTSGGDGTVAIFKQDATGQFVSHSSVAVGNGPWEVHVLTDEESDSVDLLLVNRTSGDLSFLSGDGKGSFSELTRLRSDSLVYDVVPSVDGASVVSLGAPSGITSGYFNEDGLVDVLVTSGVSSHAALLFGKQGGFVDAATILLPSPAGAVVSGDFNGDDKLDVAYLHESEEKISVHWGNGKGGFTEKQSLEAGNAPVGIVFDDNDDDLLVVNQFGDILELRGDGDGRFSEFRRIDHTVSLAVGDSVVVGTRSQDNVKVLDEELTERWSSSSLSAPENVHFADVNGDGIKDLIVANSGSTSNEDILIYLGLEGGSYSNTPLIYRSDYAPFSNPVGVNLKDLDEDGDVDLVVANQGSNTVAILRNLGTLGSDWQGFDSPKVESVDLAPVSTEIRDVTGDGVLDLLVTSSQAANVMLLQGSKDGFQRAAKVNLPGPTSKQGAVFTSDRAFVPLADGTVATFGLDAFDASSVTMEKIAIHGSAGSSISALAPVNVDGELSYRLFVTGRDVHGDAFVSFVASDNGIDYGEVRRWEPNNLDAPGAIEIVRSVLRGLEVFEVFVAQDSDIPLVRVSALLKIPAVLAGESLAQTAMQVGTPAMPIFSHEFSPEIPPIENAEFLILIANDVPTSSNPFVTIVHSVINVAAVVKSAIEISFNTILPEEIRGALVGANGEIELADLPRIGAVQLVGWVFGEVVGWQSDEGPGDVEEKLFAQIAEQLERDVLRDLEEYQKELAARESAILAELKLPIDTLLEPVPEWMRRLFRLISPPFADPAQVDVDALTPGTRHQHRLRDLAFALGATGVAGYAWHFYDKRHTNLRRYNQA